MHTLRILTALTLAASLTACLPASGDGDGGGGDPDTGASGDAGAPAEDTGSSEDAGPGEDSGAPEDTGGDPAAIPTEADALFTWLQEGGYEGWPAESAVHASTGPHGRVRTFIGPSLEASLLAESAEHPVGSASVKELHDGDGLLGWAVMVKTQAGPAADSWYWYEVFSTTSGANPVADGQGVSLCTGCHASGADYVRTPYPLQ